MYRHSVQNIVANPNANVDLSGWVGIDNGATPSSIFTRDNNPSGYGGGSGRFIVACRHPVGEGGGKDAYFQQPLTVVSGARYNVTVAFEVEPQDGLTPISSDAGVLVDVFDYVSGTYLGETATVSVQSAATPYTFTFIAGSNPNPYIRLRAYGTTVNAFFYNVDVNTDAAWRPEGAIPAAGVGTSPAPVSSPYSFDYDNLSNGAQYAFAVAYENTQGGESALRLLGVATAQPIAIAAHYMLGGTAITPTLTGNSATNQPSANGISAAVLLAATATNQPTDGSLSRVNFWYRPSNLNNDGTAGAATPGNPSCRWSPAGGGMPAAGVATATPTPSGTYAYLVSDVTGSTPYDFGLSYENTQGGESNIAPIVEGFATAVIVVSGQYLSEGSLVVPTVAGFGGTGAPTLSVAVPGRVTSQLAVIFSILNQPTDGSLAKIMLYYRQSGQSTWVFFASKPPANLSEAMLTGGATSVQGGYEFTYPDADNGTGYEFGVAIESNRGSESPTVSLGTLPPRTGPPTGAALSSSAGNGFARFGTPPPNVYNVYVTWSWTLTPANNVTWADHFDFILGTYDANGNLMPGSVVHTAQNPFPASFGEVAFVLTLVANYTSPTGVVGYRHWMTMRAVGLNGGSIESPATTVQYP